MGKKGRENKKYSAKFKIDVIMDMREHHLGYRETAGKYWDASRGLGLNYMDTVKRWECIYVEEGADGLIKKRRGRPCSTGGTRKDRPPKLDKRIY